MLDLIRKFAQSEKKSGEKNLLSQSPVISKFNRAVNFFGEINAPSSDKNFAVERLPTTGAMENLFKLFSITASNKYAQEGGKIEVSHQ